MPVYPATCLKVDGKGEDLVKVNGSLRENEEIGKVSFQRRESGQNLGYARRDGFLSETGTFSTVTRG